MESWKYENEQYTQLPAYMRHLPLFVKEVSLLSRFVGILWLIFLKYIFFFLYIRLEVVGKFDDIFKHYKRLLVISNHASHLDAISIQAAVPYKYWQPLYAAAAKDYFFRNALYSYFSKNCIGAIPIDRKGKNGQAVKLVVRILQSFERAWIILFPEGTRSKDGNLQKFKRGIGLFSTKTQTPVLFLYMDGNYRLWPKGAGFAKPGKLRLIVGPVHPPANSADLEKAYKDWVNSLKLS